MLVLQPAPRPRRRRKPKLGLAIAGGGPIGGMFELGALRAMDDAIEGLDLTRMDVYVGVSSGAFLAAGLANGLGTADMCRIFVSDDGVQNRFRPELFLRPAFFEYARRIAGVPRALLQWAGDLLRFSNASPWSDALGHFGQLIPTGLFDNAEVERFLRSVFEDLGRTNDFRKLPRKLYVVAVDLDTGDVIRFGDDKHAHVPISVAVQASSALPGLYPPVVIDGRHYVDGALRRTLHASVALEEGADLVIGLNPLVPFDQGLAARRGKLVPQSLTDGGLPAVLSQTFRTLLKSRMQVGLDKYQSQYEHSDLLLFEPDADDAEMFFTNIFSYESRHLLTEHAYRLALDDLSARRVELAPVLARHGLSLREEVLADRDRTLSSSLGVSPPRRTPVTARLRHALDDLDAALAARRAR